MCSFSGKRILELGCGTGRYTKQLAQKSIAYTALDFSEDQLLILKEKCHELSNIEYRQGDFESLDIEDKSYDVVFSSWGAVELPAMKEAERVLVPGGDIWIVTNHWEGEFMEMRGEPHISLDRTTYESLLSVGFELAATVDTNFGFPDLAMAKQSLEVIFGDKARSHLEQSHNSRLEHKVVLLHKSK